MSKLEIKELFPIPTTYNVADEISYEILLQASKECNTWQEVLELLLTRGNSRGQPAIDHVTTRHLCSLHSLILIEQNPKGDH